MLAHARGMKWRSETARGPMMSALAVSAAGLCVVALVEFGPLARHMAVHIASMNIAAPLTAVAIRVQWPPATINSPRLWFAAALQIAVLWAAHAPPIQQLVHMSLAGGVLMHSALFLTALLFWLAIVDGLSARWTAIAALLVSGKFACLLGALLIFAPRLLMAPGSHNPGHGEHNVIAPALADQHLAGLLMVTACPLSYVLAAVILTAHAVLHPVGEEPTRNATRDG